MSVRHKAVWGSSGRLVAVALLAASSWSCGDLVREGTAASYLIVQQLEGASGAEPEEFGGVLFSDTLTIVDDDPTIFSDLARVVFRLGMKDPALATAPTQANFITVTRYRVRFIRADGRNTPGVDVPFGFDGGMTLTVGDGDATGIFEVVRHAAKGEAPLAALTGSAVIITAIAEITFYGHDQTGRQVNAVAKMSVNFGNFGDPE